ncbi:MAG: superoxide dismutase family protein [Desulfovibrionaceae bacterium]
MKLRIVAFAALCGGLILAANAAPSLADSVKTPINKISDTGIEDEIGFITFTDGPEGLEMLVDVVGLTPGAHGMHIHEKGNCAPAMQDGKPVAGLSAGPHFDPSHTTTHQGPHGAGHKGDLPFIEANPQGEAKQQLKASALKVADIKGRTVMIHAGGDTYTDKPALGGGGARVACGVIE